MLTWTIIASTPSTLCFGPGYLFGHCFKTRTILFVKEWVENFVFFHNTFFFRTSHISRKHSILGSDFFLLKRQKDLSNQKRPLFIYSVFLPSVISVRHEWTVSIKYLKCYGTHINYRYFNLSSVYYQLTLHRYNSTSLPYVEVKYRYIEHVRHLNIWNY